MPVVIKSDNTYANPSMLSLAFTLLMKEPQSNI